MARMCYSCFAGIHHRCDMKRQDNIMPCECACGGTVVAPISSETSASEPQTVAPTPDFEKE